MSRFYDHFMEIACVGEGADGGVSRLGGVTPEYLQGLTIAKRQMEEAGLATTTDGVMNLMGRLPGDGTSTKAILVGSHLDTVICGGKYDGALGVSGGIEVAHRLKEEGRTLRHPLEIWGFNLEESSPVGGTFGSRCVVGMVDVEASRMEQRLAQYGWTKETVLGCQRSLHDMACYLEYHVEQGDKLDRSHVDIGVVSGIVSVIRYEVTAHGASNHAGTTMMGNRKDALVGMSKLIIYATELAKEIDDSLVFTVGKLDILPGQENVIVCEAKATFEMRHMTREATDRLIAGIEAYASQIDDCNFTIQNTTAKFSTPCDDNMIQTIAAVCQQQGVSHVIMPSGAGHDANPMAHEGVPIGMIFVPSVGGMSHCKEEFTSIAHCELGVDMLYQSILALDEALED